MTWAGSGVVRVNATTDSTCHECSWARSVRKVAWSLGGTVPSASSARTRVVGVARPTSSCGDHGIVPESLGTRKYPPGSFGGYSFVGRFEWPTAPIVLAFASLYLVALWRRRARVAGVLTALIAGLYLLQAIPVLRAEHIFYNVQTWNPDLYAGWWGSLDPSPALGFLGQPVVHYARVRWGLVSVVLLCGAATYCLIQLMRERPRRPIAALGAVLVGVFVSVPMTLSAAPLTPTLAPPATFVALGPVPICDTLPGSTAELQPRTAPCNGTTGPDAVRAGVTLDLDVRGAFGVPSTRVSAVMLGVTTLNATVSGNVTVYPAGAAAPTESALDFAPGQVVSNLVNVGIGSIGDVSLVNTAPLDVVVDLEGYFSTALGGGGGLYHGFPRPRPVCGAGGPDLPGPPGGITPCGPDPSAEIPPGKSGTSTTGTIPVAGQDGVPASAAAALLEVTALDPRSTGVVRVTPAGQLRPDVVSLGYTGGQSATDQVVVPLDPTGGISASASSPTTVLIDVVGYYASPGTQPGAGFVPAAAPTRICDIRRSNPSALDGASLQCNPGGPSGAPDQLLGPRSSRTIRVAGLDFVPDGATAVLLNVTGVGLTAPGPVSVQPSGTRPGPADLYGTVEGVTADLVTVDLARSGMVELTNTGTRGRLNLLVDVEGWYVRSGSS